MSLFSIPVMAREENHLTFFCEKMEPVEFSWGYLWKSCSKQGGLGKGPLWHLNEALMIE